MEESKDQQYREEKLRKVTFEGAKSEDRIRIREKRDFGRSRPMLLWELQGQARARGHSR